MIAAPKVFLDVGLAVREGRAHFKPKWDDALMVKLAAAPKGLDTWQLPEGFDGITREDYWRRARERDMAEHWVEHPYDYLHMKSTYHGPGDLPVHTLKNIKTGASQVYTRSELQALLTARIEKSYREGGLPPPELTKNAKRYHAKILTEWLNT